LVDRYLIRAAVNPIRVSRGAEKGISRTFGDHSFAKHLIVNALGIENRQKAIEAIANRNSLIRKGLRLRWQPGLTKSAGDPEKGPVMGA
jgi:hypothetical protein